VLKAEKEMFSRVEGGEELYRLLCEIFKVKENKLTVNYKYQFSYLP
jgi:nuclear transport factor 2 (NTF2) superfamily protein